jgi:hypothetical protein
MSFFIITELTGNRVGLFCKQSENADVLLECAFGSVDAVQLCPTFCAFEDVDSFGVMRTPYSCRNPMRFERWDYTPDYRNHFEDPDSFGVTRTPDYRNQFEDIDCFGVMRADYSRPNPINYSVPEHDNALPFSTHKKKTNHFFFTDSSATLGGIRDEIKEMFKLSDNVSYVYISSTSTWFCMHIDDEGNIYRFDLIVCYDNKLRVNVVAFNVIEGDNEKLNIFFELLRERLDPIFEPPLPNDDGELIDPLDGAAATV